MKLLLMDAAVFQVHIFYFIKHWDVINLVTWKANSHEEMSFFDKGMCCL
jgi:hypothetical protein